MVGVFEEYKRGGPKWWECLKSIREEDQNGESV